jgi:hypothetical protein
VGPLTRRLLPPDSRSLCPLSSTEFVDPPKKKKKKIPGITPPEKINSWVCHWCSIAPFCCVLVVAQPSSEVSEGLMNYPVLCVTPLYNGELLLVYNIMNTCHATQGHPKLIFVNSPQLVVTWRGMNMGYVSINF